MLKKSLCLLLLCLLLLSSAMTMGAQEASENEVFAPFVSRLQATAQTSSILLTWKDSEDVAGDCLVYRHTEQINAENWSQAELVGRVSPGRLSYTDYPKDTRPYYYAVVVEGADGSAYRLFIPFRNITLAGRGIESPSLPEPEEAAARISSLTAAANQDSIIIRFESSVPSRELLLYRSSRPLQDAADLLGAVSYVLEPGTDTLSDRPPAGLDYYYAVLDAELVKLGQVELLAGGNATSSPVQIALPKSPELVVAGAPVRPLPLPFLSITREVYSGDALGAEIPLPEPQKLSAATEEALSRILRGIITPQAPEMDVTVLTADQVETAGGEEYILKKILQEHLLNQEYQRAESELIDFLSVRRDGELEARAHFYLGQSLYFQKRYDESLMKLLMARERYYVEVDPWLSACFDKLTESAT